MDYFGGSELELLCSYFPSNVRSIWYFSDDDPALFLRVVRRMLHWLPAERLSVEEFLHDPFF